MSNKLFVGGLSPSTDDAMLRSAFEPFGELTEARVILDRDTGRSRGFGFVRYSSPEMARSALEKMGGAMLDGRSIRVDLAEDRPGPGAGPRPGPPRDGGGRWGDRPAGPPSGGRFGDAPPTSGRWGDRPAPGAGAGRFGDGGGSRFGDRPAGGAPTSGRWGDRPAPGAGAGRFGDRPAGPGAGRFGDRPAGPGAGRFGDRPAGPGGAGFRPRPGGPGGPGGAGGFGGNQTTEEGAWDDARMPRRTEPNKKKTAAEVEAERRPNKLPQKEKRISGKSWRQWADDDEAGDDGVDGVDAAAVTDVVEAAPADTDTDTE